jgi:biopolymer transport protein ExbD
MRSGRFLDSGRLRRTRAPIDFVMTPMIDVIFLLLVFFLATSSFKVVEKLMPSGVSEMGSAAGAADSVAVEISPDLLDQVIVKIRNEGDKPTAIFNGTPLAEFEALRDRFLSISQIQISTPVIIDPEPDVRASAVVTAYDWARASGLSRVYLATRNK